MNGQPNHWPAEAIWEAVVADLPDFSVEVLAQIDSTNTELMRRARAGRHEPVLLVAEHQSAGRGRLGRQWLSGDGPASALTFSLGLPLAPRDWSGLSLAVGLSIAQSLHPDLRLKWPNDIWWQARKLAGILLETASQGEARYLVVGVGINITQPQVEGMTTPPAWLQELLPGISSGQALQRVAAPLLQTIARFAQCGFAPFQTGFNARDALQGMDVSLSDGTTGVAQGVDTDGALRVRTALGLTKISSSEISVRPLPALSPTIS